MEEVEAEGGTRERSALLDEAEREGGAILQQAHGVRQEELPPEAEVEAHRWEETHRQAPTTE
jgi:hypothetical protein